MSLKSNTFLYIFLKSKGNPKRFRKNKKIHGAINNLSIINSKKYLEIHKDCLDEHMDVAAHYLYYGYRDDIEIKKRYINSLFDLDYYKNSYSCDDPILDYVTDGFGKKNKINRFDKCYIKNLEEPLEMQFYENLDEKYITNKDLLVPYIQSSYEFKSDNQRVGLFIKDYSQEISACPYIRIHDIFRELSKSNGYKFFLYGMDSYKEMDLDNILEKKQFDVIVVQRILPFLDTLLEKAKKHNIKVIYETDDDLLNVEENSPSFDYINKYKQSLMDLIGYSQTITVTTEFLASKFNNKRVKIIRNYLTSPIEIAEDINHNERIKIGYYGTLTHTKDLFLIKDVIIDLKKLMKERYNIEFDFEIIGGFNQEDNIVEDWYNEIKLPEFCEDYEKFMKWLQKNANWDMAIVPLEDSKFNNSKSELKFIELTAMGIPGVYSDVPAYNSVVIDSKNGFLASSKEDWIKKLELLILDEKLRLDIRNNALNLVLKNYNISDRVKQWDKILASI